MGGAFTGVADDANAVWANEAGLMTLDGAEIIADVLIYGEEAGSSEFLPEPEDVEVIYAAPIDDMWAWGVAGVWRGDWGFALKPGVAYNLREDILLGAGLTYDDPGDFGDDEAMSLGASALWMINDQWCAGLQVDGLWDISTATGEDEGFLEHPIVTPGVSFKPTDQWTIALDVDDALEEIDDNRAISVGAEYITVDETWALRFGWADLGREVAGADVDSYRLGAGYCPSDMIEWGYALEINAEDTDTDLWNHYVGFSYKF
jgi:long-subunit fatty acid transport protein